MALVTQAIYAATAGKIWKTFTDSAEDSVSVSSICLIEVQINTLTAESVNIWTNILLRKVHAWILRLLLNPTSYLLLLQSQFQYTQEHSIIMEK